MYVVAIHAIDDPKTFWEAALGVLAELPAGTTLHSAIPNEDGSRATLLLASPVATRRPRVRHRHLSHMRLSNRPFRLMALR